MADRRQHAIMSAIHFRAGMSQLAKEKLAKANAEMTDWYAMCPRCGKYLEGSLGDIRAYTQDCDMCNDG